MLLAGELERTGEFRLLRETERGKEKERDSLLEAMGHMTAKGKWLMVRTGQ